MPVPQRGTEKLNALFSSERVDLNTASFAYVPPPPPRTKPKVDVVASTPTPTSTAAAAAAVTPVGQEPSPVTATGAAPHSKPCKPQCSLGRRALS